MSLIIGASYQDQFVIVSNDSKVTLQYHDPETLSPILGAVEDTDLKSEKVHRLTNKVLLSTAGLMFTGDIVENELFKRVKPENDLAECVDILQKVIIDLKEGLIKNPTKGEAQGLKFLKSSSGFTCNLFGFFHNGLTGMADYNVLDSKMTISESPMEKGYPAIIQSPDPVRDRANFNKYLSLPSEERTLDDFLKRFVIVHAHISSIHKNVSTDCNFHILFKDGKTIRYHQRTVETEDFYGELGLSKERK